MPAFAQSSGSTPTPPQLTVYPTCGAAQPSKDDSEVAHGAYIAGKRAFDENDYPTAIQYFKDALRRDCTKYELLNIISRAFELKGDRPEAINALEAYVKRAPANDPSVEAIQRRIVNLKALQAAADASAKTSATPVASSAPSTTTTTTTTASASSS
ncbi:MAG: tetratricopeptide repeat protein, partial [Polyangiaceae bacterium]